MKHTPNLQPIATAPKDGTIIMGYWQSDPDPRPQKIKWANVGISQGWYTPSGFDADSEPWVECTPPTHWSPISEPTTRPAGFYRVKHLDEWTIGEYYEHNGKWGWSVISAGGNWLSDKDLDEITSKPIPMPVDPPDLYTQVKDYILNTWSKSCITSDFGHYLQASNGHLHIRLSLEPAATPFLLLEREKQDGLYTIFNGYIRNFEDFKLQLELTSIQKSGWLQ